jgi:putative redox protein
MEIANGTYLGELRVEVTHLKSGKTIITDAPPDNQGKGESFSPTDLMSVSLGTCMLTIMGIAARTNKINIEGTKMKVSKVMGSNPRRVIEVHIEFEMPSGNFSEKEKDILKNAAVTCPVAKSLHPDIIQGVNFIYK